MNKALTALDDRRNAELKKRKEAEASREARYQEMLEQEQKSLEQDEVPTAGAEGEHVHGLTHAYTQ